MRMSEMTAVLSMSTDTKVTQWWLGFSHLSAGKARIQLPLAASPYVKDVADVSKGVLARKTKQGRWRFEVVEKAEWEVPEPTEDAPRVGVDVGLNVMAATSDGELLGASLKPKFNALYAKVRDLRANRQRQGFKDNSPRLDKLEAKLTGMVKTMAGEVANKLVASHPGAVFVVEDLDLRGCRGAKRFAYRALHHSLEVKAPCEVVNPAYSSQTCPSCGYVSRSNRSGIKFICRSCGRKSHADAVGGLNLLGRSEDKEIQLDDHPSAVKALLRRRFAEKRRSPVGGLLIEPAPAPSGRRLTTRASPLGESGTASNRVEAHDQV
jgi:putative transposase